MTDQRPNDRDGDAVRPADEPVPEGPVVDAFAFGTNRPLHGLLWTQAVVEGTRRAQAALAAGALRQLGTPVMEALARHRELAASLRDAADQMSRMAGHVRDLASQHDAILAQLQASTEPYLRYIDWLDREADAPPAGGRT